MPAAPHRFDDALRARASAHLTGFERRAVGAPYAARGAVTDEYLEAMQAIWSQAEPAYAGRHAAFSRVQAHPQPVQRPWPRVIVGGRSPAAFRRAVSRAHGWYGFGLDPAGTATALAGLREAAKQVERPAALGPLEISLTPRGWGLERATAAEFAALGVHRLVVRAPRDLDASGLETFVGRCGEDLVGEV